MKHLVLLGDSIFDNKKYVNKGRGPGVIEQLEAKLPAGWQATLRAVDGDRVADVENQLAQLPADATHLVVSIGGNNALEVQERLVGDGSGGDVWNLLTETREEFHRQYSQMLDKLRVQCGLPTAVCTIYEGDLRQFDIDREIIRRAKTGLALFNDVICREAIARGMPLVDLRLACTSSEDYELAVEPSEIAGEKIVGALLCQMKRWDVEAEAARAQHS